MKYWSVEWLQLNPNGMTVCNIFSISMCHQYLNKWGRRMDKWAGRQNSGNQCFRTE